MRPRRDLYAIYATCSRPARDLYATCTRLARSGRDLGAIWARSVCDLALSPGVSDCRRVAGFCRTSPRLQTVRDCCRVPSHFYRPKSPSNLIRRYALNTLEVVWSVAGPMGRDLDAIWTRSGRDLHAICVRSARDLLAISMRSACDLCAIWCDLMRHQCDVTRH